MRQLFNTKLKIIIIVAVLLTAALSVMAGLTNHSIPELLVQGIVAPFRAAGTALTKTAERYYSYMFRYEALEAAGKVEPDALVFVNSIASVSLNDEDWAHFRAAHKAILSKLVVEITEEEEMDEQALERKRNAPGAPAV